MSVVDWDWKEKGEIQIQRGSNVIRARIAIKVSDTTDNLSVIRRDLPQFQRWQAHPTEPKFYVDLFDAQQGSSRYFWEGVVTYTDALVKDPLEEPAKIGEVKTFKLDGATILDHAKSPILNTAGEPPEPFAKPEQIVVYPIRRNIPGLQDWLVQFESCINADAVRVGSFMCEPKTLLINAISLSEENTEGDRPYRTATIELWKRKSKWLEVFPSRGFNEVVLIPPGGILPNGKTAEQSTKVLKPILAPDGQPIDRPQFLDKDGKWIKEPTPDQLVFITAQLYPAINFSAFPLK